MAAMKVAPLICAQNSSQLVLPTLQPFLHEIMDSRSKKLQVRKRNLFSKLDQCFSRGEASSDPRRLGRASCCEVKWRISVL